jgi:glycosyltransferase involved in cell wall biosynthesis
MRIAYVLYDFDIGGMPGWIHRLAAQLHRRHEIHFLATLVPRIAPKFTEVGSARYLGPRWHALYRYLRAHRIDLVQYGQSRLHGECALAAGVPVVIERTDGIRGDAITESKRGLDAVIASSRGTMPILERLISPDRVHLIYNGVDTAQALRAVPDRLGFADTDVLIGRVSRFGRGKHLHLLIDAIRILKDRHPHARLILVGGNSKTPGAEDYERELRARAADLQRWVRFVGPVDDAASLIAGFDIGTCVSRAGNEGVPNSLMECMAAGKPVVATAVDDVPELVIDGDSGLLVEDDNLEQLIDALELLITNPARRAAIGTRGRARIVEQFDVAVQAARYESLYETLLGQAAARTRLARRAFALPLMARATRRAMSRSRLLAPVGRRLKWRHTR